MHQPDRRPRVDRCPLRKGFGTGRNEHLGTPLICENRNNSTIDLVSPDCNIVANFQPKSRAGLKVEAFPGRQQVTL